MFSRAHLLIERDYIQFKKEKPWGIDAHPLTTESIFEWTAKIHGLAHTIWEGGVFRLYVKFDEHYNQKPPTVCFHTIPFHPNVDMITGQPRVDLLDDISKWSPDVTIEYILIMIQAMLSNPVLDNAVNMEAVDMILNNPHAYKQMVLDCVTASRRVEAGLSPHLEQEYSRVHCQAPTTPEPVKMQSSLNRNEKTTLCKLSFDDYHNVWTGIATSKPSEMSKNPLLEELHFKPHLQKIHLTVPFEEIQDHMSRQIEQHKTLMYGNFKSSKTADQEKKTKLNKLSQMKRIYLPKRQNTGTLSAPKQSPHKQLDEPWDKEVDDLMAWTANLNADCL